LLADGVLLCAISWPLPASRGNTARSQDALCRAGKPFEELLQVHNDMAKILKDQTKENKTQA
jgi:hypothetical protein